MTISRRQWLAGSALLGPLATHSQPPSRTDPPFCGFRAKANGIPGWSRTGFRADPEHDSGL